MRKNDAANLRGACPAEYVQGWEFQILRRSLPDRFSMTRELQLECRFECVETLLEFPLLLRLFAGFQESRTGCRRFFRA